MMDVQTGLCNGVTLPSCPVRRYTLRYGSK